MTTHDKPGVSSQTWVASRRPDWTGCTIADQSIGAKAWHTVPLCSNSLWQTTLCTSSKVPHDKNTDSSRRWQSLPVALKLHAWSLCCDPVMCVRLSSTASTLLAQACPHNVQHFPLVSYNWGECELATLVSWIEIYYYYFLSYIVPYVFDAVT